MVQYISAYDLQQRDGLARQQVLELAEAMSVVLKVRSPKILSGQEENNIDWSLYTDDRKYIKHGFKHMKHLVISDWLNHGNRFIEISKYRCEQREKNLCEQNIGSPHEQNKNSLCEYRKNGLCEVEIINRCEEHIYDRFPNIVHGKQAYKLFGRDCPEEIQNNLNEEYTIGKLVNMAGCRRMVELLFHIPEHWRASRKAIWAYLANEPSLAVDLYFEKIFREDLFFDLDRYLKIEVKQGRRKSFDKPKKKTSNADNKTVMPGKNLPSKDIMLAKDLRAESPKGKNIDQKFS